MSRGLLRSSAVVSGMTMVSRVLGFLRDMVIARVFGADAATDAFFVAFKIPNFLRRLFAEGAFSQAFVPVLSEYRETRDPAQVKELVDHVAGTLFTLLFAITAIGVIAAPVLVMVIAPGFIGDQGKDVLAADMLRLTFPYLLFISLTAFAGGILNSYGRFAIPALTPVLLNIVLIAAALFLAPLLERPVMGLAAGVFLAGLTQLVFQVPFLWRLGLMPRPRWGWAHEGVRRILRLMIPAIFGSSVAQINLLFDTLLASLLVTGSVSWLYYSDRLMEFPLGVFAIAIATVILPKLSRDHAADPAQFAHTMDWALRWLALIGVPATLGLFLLAGPMLTTLFQYGEFSPEAVMQARLSLMAYALGLPGFMLVKVLAPGFYARQDTRTPVRIGIIAMVANMVFNVILIVPLAHVGLALATSLSAYVNAGLLYHGLRKEGVYSPGEGWWPMGLRVGLAALAMTALLWIGAGSSAEMPGWFALGGWERARDLALWIGAGAGLYFAVLVLLGLRPRHMRV
ncbi:MAG: murein biosynthesis integral membrane protein MurJ [Gammaproteobacteria bacterium]